MVADHPLTPDRLRGLARKLNHFGGVAISEEGVEFDRDHARWSDITETRSLIEYLFTGGVDKQADKPPLPWFPFRGKVIETISRGALKQQLDARWDFGAHTPAQRPFARRNRSDGDQVVGVDGRTAHVGGQLRRGPAQHRRQLVVVIGHDTAANHRRVL
jgi:hypothetical protein